VVVAAIDGVLKLTLAPKAVPPVATLYHFKVPALAVADKATIPVSHLLPGVVVKIVGIAVTVMKSPIVLISLPLKLVATNVTLYVPVALYCTVGFCSVDVAGVPPGKLQFHTDGALAEVSVKVTVLPTQIAVGAAEKFATGGVTGQLAMTSIAAPLPAPPK